MFLPQSQARIGDMKIFGFILAIFAVMGCVSGAHAQRSDAIAAVVNGDVITYTDVYDRIDLVIKSSGMPNTKEFRQKLLPQILTGLITESIQIQEAKRLGLETSSEELEEGFARIAQQNQMKPEQFAAILKRQQVRRSTIDRQILAQLAWGKVIQREVRPRIVLSDSDITDEMNRLKGKEGQTEYLMAEIFLPFDTAEGGEAKTREVAADLKKQLDKDIQKFPAAARQFSQNASAANGGILGWMTPDQMTEDMALAVNNLKSRELSNPIRLEDGYALLFIRDKRVINFDTHTEKAPKLRIKVAVFPLPDDQAGRENQRKAADIFARDVAGCLDIVKRTSDDKSIRLDDIHDTTDHIPSDILAAVENKSIGEAAAPIVKESTISVPMLCGRDGGDGGISPLEMEVEQRMGVQRMEILQKRYLRDLISDAYIERRV